MINLIEIDDWAVGKGTLTITDKQVKLDLGKQKMEWARAQPEEKLYGEGEDRRVVLEEHYVEEHHFILRKITVKLKPKDIILVVGRRDFQWDRETGESVGAGVMMVPDCE